MRVSCLGQALKDVNFGKAEAVKNGLVVVFLGLRVQPQRPAIGAAKGLRLGGQDMGVSGLGFRV